MAGTRMFVMVVFLLFGGVAGALERTEVVSSYWQLDQQARKIVEKISFWVEESGSIEAISAKQSYELEALIEDAMRLADHANELRQNLSDARRLVSGEMQFEQLYSIDSSLSNDELFDVVMYAAVELTMYEFVSFVYHLAEESKTLIKRLNEVEVNGETKHFARVEKIWLNVKSKKAFAKALDIIKDSSSRLNDMQAQGDLYLIALRDRLDTYMAEEIRDSAKGWSVFGGYFKKVWKFLLERNKKRLNWMEYHLSKVFGNIAGSMNIQSFLNSIPKETLESVKSAVLQPGDVIVEKTEGAITDKFIPGHFGHVAVYFGTYDQVKDLRLSDGSLLVEHEAVKRFLPLLKEGDTTVEAVRPGTRLENIAKWNITDLAVLRAASYPKERIGDVLLKAIEYVGTVYDFNFDVNTRSIVVCSELPYQVFAGINFRIAKFAGRWTISPDDVAVLAGKKGVNTPNRPFELVHFIHDTKVVPEDQMFDLYVSLLEAEKSRYNDVPENNHEYNF